MGGKMSASQIQADTKDRSWLKWIKRSLTTHSGHYRSSFNSNSPIRKMKKIDSPDVLEVFNSYPPSMRKKLMFLRQLVLETASETKGVGEVEETLKWGEPSYLAKGGSPIRMDWKSTSPSHYAMYFNCKTKLVDTFKEIYGDRLKFEGNRAIIFSEQDDVPTDILKHCISLALTYHARKKLPMLGT